MNLALNRASKAFAISATIFLNIIFLSVNSANAQLDPTFGSGGVKTVDVFAYDRPLNSFLLPDGKILIVSVGETVTSTTVNYYFVRLTADGTPDATYGTNGVVQLSIPFISSVHGINNAYR